MTKLIGNNGLLKAYFRHENVQQQYAPLIDYQVEEYDKILDEMNEKLQSISTSSHLTNAGKAEARKKVGMDAVNKIAEKAKSPRSKLELDLRDICKNAPSFPSRKKLADDQGISDMSLEIQFGRYQDELRKQEPFMREATLKTAVKLGDAITIAAAASLPPTFAIFDSNRLNNAKAEWMTAAHPEFAAAIDVVNQAHQHFDGNINIARKVISKATGIFLEEDKVRQLAHNKPADA